MNKSLISLIIVIFLLIIPSTMALSVNNYKQFEQTSDINATWDPDIHIFYDVYVKITGRCRTISSPSAELWDGGLYEGHLNHAGAIVGNTAAPPDKQDKLAYLNIIIKDNKDAENVIFSCNMVVGPISTEDSTGTFYWEAEGMGVSPYPPEIFIECHSKGRVQVHVYHRDDSNNNWPDKPYNPNPKDGASGISTNPTLSAYVQDPDGDKMDVSFHTRNGSLIDTVYNVPSGGKASITWDGRNNEKDYEWYAVADDGKHASTAGFWEFKTKKKSKELRPSIFNIFSNLEVFKILANKGIWKMYPN